MPEPAHRFVLRRRTPTLVVCILVVAAAWASGASASRPPWARPDTLQPRYPHLLLSVPQAQALRSAQWLDARPAAEFARGHLPGAIHLDPRQLPWEPARLAAALRAAGVRGDRDLVCYADGAHTAAAGTLLWLLETAGSKRVRVLNGGMEAWSAAGGGVETGPVKAPAGDFDTAPDTSRWADAARVRAIAGRDGYEILEARSEAEWERGHIPHALPFPVDSLWGRSLGLRDGESLRAVFSGFGPRPADPISLADEIVVCMQGGRPDTPSLYLAAREAGIGRVRGYAGGFETWRRDESAPVVRIVSAEEVRAKAGGGGWWDRLVGRRDTGVLLFDVRSRRDFEVGHLPGAVSLPSHRFAEEFESLLRERWPGLDRARTAIVFYCYGPSCIRSRHCASVAAWHGFRNLLWFRDGIEGWYALGERLVSD